MTESPPSQVALRHAASAPKANAPRDWQVATELAVMVVAPLLVPNLVLFAVRGELQLLDVGLSFVALAVATLTKMTTTQTQAWKTAGVVSALGTTVFIGASLAKDSYSGLAQLLKLAGGGTASVAENAATISRLAESVDSTAPSLLQWLITCLCGLGLAALDTYLILKRDR